MTIWKAFIAGLSGMLLVGLGTPGAQAAEDLVRIRVGTLKQSALTDIWVAKEAGFFTRNGLDAELIEFRNGNEAIAAHRGGSVDFVLSIPGTAMVAVERGFDLVLVAQNETAKASPPDSGSIQVLAESPVRSLAELSGKRVAVSGLHSQMTVGVQSVLQKAGVDLSKIQLVELPFASMVDALKSKQIDAVAELDPWTTQMQVQGIGRVLGWTYIDSIPEQPIGAWFAKRDYIARNADIVRRFRTALQQTIDYMNADPERARRNVALYTGLDPALTKSMPLNNWTYRIRPERWQAVIDLMKTNGELQRPHDVKEYLSAVVAEDILQ